MNNHGDTPLHWAIQNGRASLAEMLRQHGGLERGYDAGQPANAATNWDVAVLRGAIKSGDAAQIEKSLRDDTSLLESKDEQNRTPLILAAMSKHRESAEVLLANNASVNAKDMFGRTALHWAALIGAPEVAGVLLAHKADIAAKDQGGARPLHLAARNGYLEVVKVLITHGEEVNAPDDKGQTPLHWVEGELQRGASLQPQNPAAKVYTAREDGMKAVAEWLRQHGGKE
jgi:ankyrin repeat protein